MGGGVTLKHLKDRALYRADMTLGFIDSEQLTHDVGDSLATLYDTLVSQFDGYGENEWFYIDTVAYGATGFQGNYDLPVDFLKAIKVYKVVNTFERIELEKFSMDEFNKVTRTPSATDFKYRFIGNEIWLHPNPTVGTLVELWYIKHFSRPKIDSDIVTMQAPSAWQDYVVCDAAAKILIREESDPTVLLMERDKALASIKGFIQDRDADPDVVRDVDKRFGKYDPDYWLNRGGY